MRKAKKLPVKGHRWLLNEDVFPIENGDLLQPAVLVYQMVCYKFGFRRGFFQMINFEISFKNLSTPQRWWLDNRTKGGGAT